LTCRRDRVGVMLVPELPQLRERIVGFLIGGQQNYVGNRGPGKKIIARDEMRVQCLKIENLKEPEFVQRPGCQHAADGQHGTEGPVLPLPGHVNLHLTTLGLPTVNFSWLRRVLIALRVHTSVNAARMIACAALLVVAGYSQTTQGLISGRLVSSVTG